MDYEVQTMNTVYVSSLTPPQSLKSLDALSAYLTYVKCLPLLSAEEEKILFERFNQESDLQAARKIVQSHLRFVVYVAKSYTGYGLPLEDIIQEGNVGLMKSVKRFNLSYEVRFATFASHWIKAEINEYILKNWRLIKIATTKAQRKLFFNLRKAKKRLTRLTKSEASQIAKELNVNTKDVIEMESRLHQNDCFFDESFGEQYNDENNNTFAKSIVLEDQSNRPDSLYEVTQIRTENRKLLQTALRKLDSRRRDIIMSRWLAKEKTSLKDLSARYDVSEERIRQIEKDAMQRIKVTLQANDNSQN
jgi:RNA polymerase sigma-32 factor